MSSVKEIIRQVRCEAEEAITLHDGNPSTCSDEEALRAIAWISIKQLLQQSAEMEEEERDALKAARQVLKRGLAPREPVTSPVVGDKRPRTTEEASELGQYATAGAFDASPAKKAKFARLMGGTKVASAPDTSNRQHNTLAASSVAVKRMNADLTSQFEAAMAHKGRHGLGA